MSEEHIIHLDLSDVTRPLYRLMMITFEQQRRIKELEEAAQLLRSFNPTPAKAEEFPGWVRMLTEKWEDEEPGPSGPDVIRYEEDFSEGAAKSWEYFARSRESQE